MKYKNTYLLIIQVVIMSFSYMLNAQYQITGTIKSAKEQTPIAGVIILVESNDPNDLPKNFYSGFDGTFNVRTSIKSGVLQFSISGYQTITYPYSFEKAGKIDLEVVFLREPIVKQVIVNSSTIDVVKDRKSPVASSTFFNKELNGNLGNKDFVEVFNNVSGIYTSRVGGGFGDSRIAIRGFNQNNIAPMIDGIPFYDLETGFVDWNGILSINDVVGSVQIQKGLGASKIVNSSVAGTVNMILKDSDFSKGGILSNTSGNDGFRKFLASYSTGRFANGFSLTASLSTTDGDGYVDNTAFRAYSYYLAFGLKKKNHNFQVKVFGSPQWHDQRVSSLTLIDYLGSFDPNNFQSIRPKYNKDWGYLNGQCYSTSTNYGHKPVGIFQWDWDLTKKSQLSTKIYGSYGSSARTGLDGGVSGFGDYSFVLPGWNYSLNELDIYNQNVVGLNNTLFLDNAGQIDFNNLVRYNKGEYAYFTNVIPQNYFVRLPYFDTNGNPVYYNSSRNGDVLLDRDANRDYPSARSVGVSHITNINNQKIYGGLLNFKTLVDKSLTLNFGLDARKTVYNRTQNLVNLFGANAYWINSLVRDNYNPPFQNFEGLFMNSQVNLVSDTYSPKNEFYRLKSRGNGLDFDYDSKIDYLGAYGQAELDLWKFNFLFQGGFNRQFIQKTNNRETNPDLASTPITSLEGYNIKAGFNFNINSNHNVWSNFGKVSRPPVFIAVYSGIENSITESYRNQDFKSVEAGYGFRNKYLAINLNGYFAEDTGSEDPYFLQGYGNLGAITEINKKHRGVELDFTANLTSRFNLGGSFTYGEWKYVGQAEYRGYDRGEIFERVPLNIDGFDVGGAPQRVATISGNYRFFDNLVIGSSYRYSDRMYSSAPLWQYAPQFYNRKAPLELPGFGVMDSYISYKFGIHSNKQTVSLRLNVDNVLNELFISESNSSILPTDNINSNPANGTFLSNDYLYNGVPTTNSVLFGFGRTWNFNITLNF